MLREIRDSQQENPDRRWQIKAINYHQNAKIPTNCRDFCHHDIQSTGLGYIRYRLGCPSGIEPETTGPQPAVLPLHHRHHT